LRELADLIEAAGQEQGADVRVGALSSALLIHSLIDASFAFFQGRCGLVYFFFTSFAGSV
jgi:hypothetical protein